MMQYFFTKFGDIYVGYKWEEMEFPDHTIIIPSDKLIEYKELKHSEKTYEKICEYGWIIGNNTIETILNNIELQPEKNYQKSDSCYGGYDRKVMFIFGAGASANCVYGNQKNDFYKDILRPPIGPALFEDRFREIYLKYKGVKQSLIFLQNEQNPDVEELFENEWKNIHLENNQEVLNRHINILYYLQEVLKKVSGRIKDEYFAKNLYASLADKLQKLYSASIKTNYGNTTSRKFAFVSFNQDIILDGFISEYFRKPINSLDDYVNVNDSPFCIFKPHGSCNWGWEFPDISIFGDNIVNWLFDKNINFYQLYYTLLGNYTKMVDWSTWGHEMQMNKNRLGKFTIDKSQIKIIDINKPNNYFPALLLPYRDKDEFTMPIRHFNNMQSYLEYIETLVIIGWKGNEDAFNRILFQKGNKISKIIIADPNSNIVIKNLEPILIKNKINPIIYNSFEDFIITGLDKEID